MASKLILTLASTAALFCAGAAHANGVTWSIGINAPGIGTVISNAPVYRPAPIYVPAPVVYEEPAPVVYQQPRVAYQQPQVVYRPVPRIYEPMPVVYERGPGQWVPAGHRRDGDRDWNRDGRRWHHEGRDDRRDRRDQRDGNGKRYDY